MGNEMSNSNGNDENKTGLKRSFSVFNGFAKMVDDDGMATLVPLDNIASVAYVPQKDGVAVQFKSGEHQGFAYGSGGVEIMDEITSALTRDPNTGLGSTFWTEEQRDFLKEQIVKRAFIEMMRKRLTSESSCPCGYCHLTDEQLKEKADAGDEGAIKRMAAKARARGGSGGLVMISGRPIEIKEEKNDDDAPMEDEPVSDPASVPVSDSDEEEGEIKDE
jgi:hypothetical protein